MEKPKKYDLPEIKSYIMSFAVSAKIVSTIFRELSNKVQSLPKFERELLEELLKRLQKFDTEISEIANEFDNANKQYLSEEEQRKLWELDNSIIHLKTNLIMEEIQYKIKTRPTIASNNQVDKRILDETDRLLKDWKEISDGLKSSIRNKIESIVMQKGMESSQKILQSSKELVHSSKKLERTSNILLIVTIALLILGIITVACNQP